MFRRHICFSDCVKVFFPFLSFSHRLKTEREILTQTHREGGGERRRVKRKRDDTANKDREYKHGRVVKMAGTSIPLTNVGSGYTIVTQVIPSSSAPTTVQQNSSQTLSPLQKFLKGEPKALGTVQVMIGIMTILFGIVLVIYPETTSVFSGLVFWSSLLHISAGSLAISASNNFNSCVVKAALGLNIFSAIAAGIAIIILSLDLVFGPPHHNCYNYDESHSCSERDVATIRTNGITGVLLVFSLLQFFISIIVSAFTCKATCTNEPALSIINVISNLDERVPVVNSFSDFQPQQEVSTLNTVSMNFSPMENPPAYSQKKQPDSSAFL